MHRYRTARAPGNKELSRLNINYCWVSIDLSEVLTWDGICIQMSRIPGVICSKYTCHSGEDSGILRNADLFPKATRFVQRAVLVCCPQAKAGTGCPAALGRVRLTLFAQSVCVQLQEVETEQYFTLFLPALKERGYDGFFSPKSRAKIMSEQERKHVDGCAIFFKTEK